MRANNPSGLPPFMDYRLSELRSETIPELHQAIIPSYRFTCYGNITEWGVDILPAGGMHDGFYNLDLQVWRPSPTVQTTGCYSLVGINRFTSVPLPNQVAEVTPLPQEQIEFQPGDVLGFNLENTGGDDGGVVILMDSSERGDSGYETEEVWYADFSNPFFGNGECQLVVGGQPQAGGGLNTMTSAAPVLSVAYSKSYMYLLTIASLLHILYLTISCYTIGITSCPPIIKPTVTTLPVAPSQPILTEPNPVTSTDKVADSILDQTGTEDNPLNNSSDTLGLIAVSVVAALMVIIIVILTAVLGFIIVYKKQKKEVSMATNQAYGTALQDTAVNTEGDTYDYPSTDNQAKSSIDTKMNEAYATNAEAKPCIAYGTSTEVRPCVAYGTSDEVRPCVAYATNISAERNAAYGVNLQDVVTCRVDTKMNEAYATNAEANPYIAYGTSAEARLCVAYATNISAERNAAYGVNLQDVIRCREGDAYDYPTMDS